VEQEPDPTGLYGRLPRNGTLRDCSRDNVALRKLIGGTYLGNQMNVSLEPKKDMEKLVIVDSWDM
jgi:hypothetical protein